MLEAAAVGFALGLGAGLSPGPLLGLVILASLRGGARSGTKVAIAPLLTDLPIVVLSLTLVSTIPDRAVVILSIVGGVVVVGLGVQALREARRPLAEPSPEAVRRTIAQGIAVNVLSPHPWVFWLGVGAPITVAAWDRSAWAAAAFLVLFYLLLVGSKIVLAFVVAGARARFSDRVTWWLGIVAGVLMLVSGVVLIVGAIIGT